jgi:hypothetical protein
MAYISSRNTFNSIHPMIRFTMETDEGDSLLFQMYTCTPVLTTTLHKNVLCSPHSSDGTKQYATHIVATEKSSISRRLSAVQGQL